MRNFILILICFLTYNLTAQTSGKYKGRDIKISDDGTWRYVDELECDFNGKRIIINANGTWDFADGKSSKTKSSKTKTKDDKNNTSTAGTSNSSKTKTKDDKKNTKKEEEEVEVPEPEPEPEVGYSEDDNGELTSKLLTIIDRVDYSGGFGFTIKRTDHKVNWSITCTGRDKCTEQNAPIDIVFADGTKMKFTNREEDNCNYLTSAKFSLKNEIDYKKYAMLSSVGIKKMRVKTKNSEVDFPFSAAQAQKVMDLFKSVYTAKL